MAIGDNSFVFDLEPFIKQMGEVSDAIKREVGALVQPAADQMLATITARYPLGTYHPNPDVPHMRDDGYIRTVQSQNAFLPVRKVVGPRLAYIWQNGTAVRHNYTRKGANRGRSPQHDKDFFERTAVQTRAAMMAQAQAIVDQTRSIG